MIKYFINFLYLCTLLSVNTKLFSQSFNVKQFGAKADGITDDTKAIQAAIVAASVAKNSTVYFPSGIYIIGSYTKKVNYLENYCLKIHSNITFKGDGITSIIKLASHIFDKSDTMANAHIFYGTSIKNVQFTNMMIDMNGANNLVPKGVIKNNMALFIYEGSGIEINKITIKNCSGTNMVAIKGKGKRLLIKNSSFYNGGNYVGTTQPNKYQIDFSFIYSEWDSTNIVKNHIEQENIDIALSNYSGGIELHGSFSEASCNTIIGCNPAVYISSSWYALTKTLVTRNNIKKCVRGISFWVHYPLNNIQISDNKITLTHSRSDNFPLITGIEVPNGNILDYNFKLANAANLTNLVIKNNTVTSLLNDTSQIKSAGMVLHSLESCRIENNEISRMNYGGIILQGSKWGMNSLVVIKNNFLNFRVNNDKTAIGGYIIITDTYTNSLKKTVGFKNIFFLENKFKRSSNNSKNLNKQKLHNKFFGAFIALPLSTLSEIHFDNNTFSDKREKVHFVNTD